MGAPRRFFRRSVGFRGTRGSGGPPRRPYQDDNQVKILLILNLKKYLCDIKYDLCQIKFANFKLRFHKYINI